MRVRLVDASSPPCSWSPKRADMWAQWRGQAIEVGEPELPGAHILCGTPLVLPIGAEQLAAMGVAPPADPDYYVICQHQVAEVLS